MKGILKTAVMIAIAGPCWAQSAGIDLQSSSGDNFSVGQVVTLDLQGSNWTQPLDGGGLDLSFNPAVLSLQSVTVNTDVFDLSLAAPLPAPTIDNSGGTATGIDFFTLNNRSPTGNFDIASLTFVTLGVGAANLSLTEDAIGLTSTDANLNVTSLVAGTDFNFQTADVNVSSMVAPVPEPSTSWLLIVAAFAGVSLRQWKLRSSSS